MIVKCQRCGAPLDVSESTRFATCEYCGATTALEQPKPPSPRHFPPQPPPLTGAAPHPYASRPAQVTPASGAGKNSKVGVLMVAVSVLVALGGAVVPLVVNTMSSGVSIPGVISNVMGPSAWSSQDPACLVDANSDGVLDVAGLSGRSGAMKSPTVIDGATGKVLWKRPPTSDKGRVVCLDRRWFAVWQPDFKIYFYDATGTKQPTIFTGTDELRKFGPGKGCVALETADKAKKVVSLGGASPGGCRPAPLRSVYASLPGHVGLTDYSSTLRQGTKTLTLTKRRSGTGMLTLQLQAPGRPGWSKHLTWMTPSFGSAVAIGQGIVVVWAAKPGHGDQGFLVGLDENTGAQLYAVRAPGQVTHDVTSLQFNGRYFIASYWVELRAFDPKTGKVAWVVGR